MFSLRFTWSNTDMADLSTKTARRELVARDAPHWQRLSEGCYLGFRTSSETWLARYRDRNKHQQHKALGGPLEFDEAKKLAEQWLLQMTGSATRTPTRGTVRSALEVYIEHLNDGRPDAATEAEGRFKLTVYGDVIADLSLERATKEDFREWRKRLTTGRKPRSVNRHVRSVIAGLNYAHEERGHVGNPSTWKLKPLADTTTSEHETAVFLTPAQRKALISAATPAAALFFRGLELTGARPKELAAATEGHFDGRTLRLAHRKGNPPVLRVRHTELSPEGVLFFEQMTADKLPMAPIFTEDGVTPWRRHMWARAVRAAVLAHNAKARGKDRLPAEGVGAYAFRHARISELLQKHGIDPLTVAAATGTSLAMIELAYFKFIPDALRDKLRTVKEA
jgi:integrase